MWRDHPFSQRNRTIERAVGVGVGRDKEVGGGAVGWTKLEKKEWGGGEEIGGGGGLNKIGGLAPLCQLCKETFPSHPL